MPRPDTAPRRTDDLRQIDLAHHLHPFTDHAAFANEGGGRIIVRGEGIWLWDSDDNRILDGMSGLWCVNVGYGRRPLIEAAADQMARLAYYNTFFKTATPPAVELARVLAECTPPGLEHVFFAGSGSEAVDTAVRLVRHYWALKGAPRRRVIIGRRHGYHGSTLAAASVGGMAPMHRQGDLPLPDFTHVLPPYAFEYARPGEDADAFGRRAAAALEERILDLGADRVAAFIAEPIQGAGGVLIPPDSYWPEVQRICARHDVLLVADEVICGFGRTGRWFGADRFAIRPDVMTLAKGITSGYVPMAAVMVGERVARTLIDDGGEFFHGFTYSGHPVAAAVALANLALIREEGLVERVAQVTGPALAQRLAETFAGHPLVGEVRSCGLLAAIELVDNPATRRRFAEPGKVGTRCRDHAFAGGLVMRAVRDTMVLAPPLIITEAEIDELVTRARAAIDATARDLGRL